MSKLRVMATILIVTLDGVVRALSMSKSNTRCIACRSNHLEICYTLWECLSCGQQYPCLEGIPQLFIESNIGQADRSQRARLYNNLLGRFYAFLMPFLCLAVRPIRTSLVHWLAYFTIMMVLCFLFWKTGEWLFIRQTFQTTVLDVIVLALLVASILFLRKHPYLWKLLVLAIPTKISLALHPFRANKGFAQIHADFQAEYLDSTEELAMLDVASGSCNSLFRHGWMELNARYVAADLSQDMLLQGAKFMTAQQVPVDFVFADAHELPFASESFDIVSCYGAVNGYTNPAKALDEMARVTKKGGKILFLDEQLYDNATYIEQLYLRSVLDLSNLSVIDHCPVEMLPAQLEAVQVEQVYQFYYICTARKRGDAAA